MLVAVPSDAPGGLEAPISAHFGHCDAFTLVQIDDGKAGEVTIVKNEGHAEGGCLSPVTLLKEKGAEALLAGGMGARPLAGFRQVGIAVYSTEGKETVAEAVELFAAGECTEFADDATCGGHGGHCGGHHHAPVVREVVDGPIAEGLVARVAFRLLDDAGEEIDQADEVLYLHGQGQIVPGLERALEGQAAGAELSVTVAPADGFGERDDNRVLRVPVAELPDGITVGATVQAELPNGGILALTMTGLDGDTAVLDANHPLAGITLVFEVKVLEVLRPTAEELEHGHVH